MKYTLAADPTKYSFAFIQNQSSNFGCIIHPENFSTDIIKCTGWIYTAKIGALYQNNWKSCWHLATIEFAIFRHDGFITLDLPAHSLNEPKKRRQFIQIVSFWGTCWSSLSSIAVHVHCPAHWKILCMICRTTEMKELYEKCRTVLCAKAIMSQWKMRRSVDFTLTRLPFRSRFDMAFAYRTFFFFLTDVLCSCAVCIPQVRFVLTRRLRINK